MGNPSHSALCLATSSFLFRGRGAERGGNTTGSRCIWRRVDLSCCFPPLRAAQPATWPIPSVGHAAGGSHLAEAVVAHARTVRIVPILPLAHSFWGTELSGLPPEMDDDGFRPTAFLAG